MIAKEYGCDLCRDKTRLVECGWKRLKFTGEKGFTLVDLVTCDSASEQIICTRCLDTLKRLLCARPQ